MRSRARTACHDTEHRFDRGHWPRQVRHTGRGHVLGAGSSSRTKNCDDVSCRELGPSTMPPPSSAAMDVGFGCWMEGCWNPPPPCVSRRRREGSQSLIEPALTAVRADGHLWLSSYRIGRRCTAPTGARLHPHHAAGPMASLLVLFRCTSAVAHWSSRTVSAVSESPLAEIAVTCSAEHPRTVSFYDAELGPFFPGRGNRFHVIGGRKAIYCSV